MVNTNCFKIVKLIFKPRQISIYYLKSLKIVDNVPSIGFNFNAGKPINNYSNWVKLGFYVKIIGPDWLQGAQIRTRIFRIVVRVFISLNIGSNAMCFLINNQFMQELIYTECSSPNYVPSYGGFCRCSTFGVKQQFLVHF